MKIAAKLTNSILKEDLVYIHNQVKPEQKFKDSTILITGCAGFLGYYFLNYFLAFKEILGFKKIICLDNFILGKPSWLKTLEDSNKEYIDLYPFDISKDKISSINNSAEADYIIHMASIASPVFYRKYPLQTIDANIWGLRNLLEYYKANKLKGFLFFSSSEIYGDPAPDCIPTHEEYRGNVSMNGPRACYDESKRFGETLCYVFSKEYKLPITIVRPFNNYGPGMKLNDKRAPADFANSIISNKDIILYSDGKPTRTFCYVADAIGGYLKSLLLGKYEYFNIGIDKPEISIRELAEIYLRQGKLIYNYTGKIVLEKSQEENYLTHNPNRRCPDIDKSRKILSYTPSIHVEEGVGKFLKFLKYGGVNKL
ncbi:NAD-dependent epimerase/dehydratase family protein [Sutcliffiella horikoshii]|uniref:NAD-dependent epimerase/dehydratase family protein n=1 Tax=Sutcliffiella horikoshii TaxID=79883 RepID=UPI001CFE04AC|nr:NAD-dependent epimerase/dehydratase family protein [Sutcliffiella horikoshii]